MIDRIKQFGLPLIAAGSIALLSFAPAAAQGTYPPGGSTGGYGMPPAPYMMQHSQAVPRYGYGPAPSSRYGMGTTSYGSGYAGRRYTVVYGDTLLRIAARFGVSEYALLAANPSIRNPNLIFAGQTLVIPSSRGAYSSNGGYAAPAYPAATSPSGAYQAPGAASGGYAAPAAPQAAPMGNSTPAAAQQTAQIVLVAHNMAFSQSTLTAPAGAHVVVQFNNMDAMPHSFAVYTDSSARQAIFKGQILMGPGSTTYEFDAPSQPGTYFFRCDVHPTVMNGRFVVTSGS